jgi:non-ribosomal peptide synthetase component F
LQLPSDRPRPPVRSGRGGTEHLLLPPALTQGLQALSGRAGCTLFMTTLAAFDALLCQLTGEEDVVVGTPNAGRSHVELEGLIGFFVNTLVLRADLSGDPAFTEILGRVREATLGAYAHQELPFDKLVEELNVRREPGRSPVFQIMFGLQTFGGMPERLGELELELLDVSKRSSPFDLNLAAEVVTATGELRLEAEYPEELFSPAVVRQLLDAYRQVLEAVVARPEARLSELPRSPLAQLEPAAPATPAAAQAPRRAADLEARRARLTDAQREALARRLKGKV